MARLYPAMQVGVAYKAKMVCSGVFVAGGEPREVIRELEVDDLEVLRYVNAEVDASPNTYQLTGPPSASKLGASARGATSPRKGPCPPTAGSNN
jgi:hypothetical protein